MSDTDSDSNNEGKLIKLPKTFKAYNSYHTQPFMNNVPSELELKTSCSNNDVVDSDTMAPRDVASCHYKMAARIFSEGSGLLSQQPPGEADDLLAMRKATIDAYKMAAKNMAEHRAQLRKWRVEATDDPLEALQSAISGGGIPANVYGGSVPPHYGEAARSTTPLKVIDNTYENKMVACTGIKTAADRYKMAAGIGKKMTVDARYNMATAARQKMAPAMATRRCSNGSCYVVTVGSHNVHWLQEGGMMFPTHSPEKCTYGNSRRTAVRPGLWRVTLQALCLMTLAIFLTYFAIHFMERFMRKEN